MTIPKDWLSPVKMERIVFHWTAGRHKASSVDIAHYHVLIEGDGNVVRGAHTIAQNARPIKGKYAAHTLNTNTGSIGVSMCCMWNAKESPFNPGPAPMTRKQWDVCADVIAELCKFYKIPVGPKTVLSHAEVQGTLGIRQRNKWDVARLAFDAKVVGAKACGDLMRSKVSAILNPPAKPAPPLKPLPQPIVQIPGPPDREPDAPKPAPPAGFFMTLWNWLKGN